MSRANEERGFSGEALKKAIKLKKLTQKKVSELMGIREATVSDWVKGKKVPESYNMDELVRILEQPRNYFYADTTTDVRQAIERAHEFAVDIEEHARSLQKDIETIYMEDYIAVDSPETVYLIQYLRSYGCDVEIVAKEKPGNFKDINAIWKTIDKHKKNLAKLEKEYKGLMAKINGMPEFADVECEGEDFLDVISRKCSDPETKKLITDCMQKRDAYYGELETVDQYQEVADVENDAVNRGYRSLRAVITEWNSNKIEVDVDGNPLPYNANASLADVLNKVNVAFRITDFEGNTMHIPVETFKEVAGEPVLSILNMLRKYNFKEGI